MLRKRGGGAKEGPKLMGTHGPAHVPVPHPHPAPSPCPFPAPARPRLLKASFLPGHWEEEAWREETQLRGGIASQPPPLPA